MKKEAFSFSNTRYADRLDEVMQNIVALIERGSLSKEVAAELMRFFIKKELHSDLNSFMKRIMGSPKKEKSIVIQYQNKSTNYSNFVESIHE